MQRVGDEWDEPSVRPEGPHEKPVERKDRYRIVEVTGPDGRQRFEETVVRDSGQKRPPRWTRRGSANTEAGKVAEEASLAETRKLIADAKPGELIMSLGPQSPNGGCGLRRGLRQFIEDGRQP